MGPSLGGTRVAVYGSNFLEDVATILCRFQSTGGNTTSLAASIGVVVPARFIAFDQLDCVAPSGTHASYSYVEISHNLASNFSYSQVPYSYYAPPEVLRFTPAHVAAEGGTLITIHGSGFSAEAATHQVTRNRHTASNRHTAQPP